MVNVIVLFPGMVSVPGLVVHPPGGTGVGVRLGVRVIVGVSVLVDVIVTVGEVVDVLVRVGVLVKIPGSVDVAVAVLVEVGVNVGVPVLVGVDVSGCQLEGGAVTKMETLTITVRALCAVIGPLALVSERSRKPTILGTIGR